MSLSDTDSDIFHDALEQEFIDIENDWSFQAQHSTTSILHETTNSDSFIPKEMPSSPPPPPPISPTKSPNYTKKTSKKGTKKMKDVDNHPFSVSDHNRITNDQNQTTKKKKKSKKKKQTKNPKAKTNAYEKQYKSSAMTSDHIYIPTKNRDHGQNVSWFRFWGGIGNSNAPPIAYGNDAIFAKFSRSGKRKINIGELNSAHGEGTTVPQLLTRVRYITFFLAICTIVMESWAFLFHVILLEADKIVMGFYLMFFVGLLVCYEIVRGQPRPGSFVDGNWTDMVVFHEFDVAELVWKTVLESKITIQIRYFLQENFGILYSCWGRGIYLCFVGGISLGQGILWMGKLVGGMFIMFGIWTISLKYRHPLFEKALIMDLDHEFKTEDTYQKYNRESIVTWTSLRSRMNNNIGERQQLIKAAPKMNHY
jgi:hypothetical protein